MKQHLIIKNNQKHLLLFLVGWGVDETPFLTIHPTDKNWTIRHDYRSLTFDIDLLKTYSQIILITWSMGVWAALQVMKQYPHLSASQSVTINDTLYPIHEAKDIAHSIFNSILQGLNEQTLQKFQRGTCGSAANYKTFQTISLQRPMEELKEELAAMQQQYLSPPPSDSKRQRAIMGKGDRTLLPDNQYLAWENQVDSPEQVEAAYYQRESFNTTLMQLGD